MLDMEQVSDCEDREAPKTVTIIHIKEKMGI
jgi:hypothetical protein